MIVKLLDDLRRRGWHSSIMTTYSVDPSFYDGTIEMRLRVDGCRNNILIADRGMLGRALSATPEAFVNAGRTYLVADVAVSGCFHPKLHLRMAGGRARLVAGSANVTAAGWGWNREVVTAIEWQRNAQAGSDSQRVGPLIAKAFRYLEGWLEGIPGDAVAYKREYFRRYSPWIVDLEPNNEPILLEDGSAIDLLCERADGRPGILETLRVLVGDEAVKRIIVVSPYWDAGLEGLDALQKAFAFPPTLVALDPTSNTFPADKLGVPSPVVFRAVPPDRPGRFLHAKIIVVETAAADHVLFGSANCSDDALGSLSAPPRNAESSVYRRYRADTAIELLALDLSQAVEPSTLEPPQARKPRSPTLPHAGTIELVDEWLVWWPPAKSDPAGALITIGRAQIPVVPAGSASWRGRAPSQSPAPIVARIRYADDRLSAPVIVNDRRKLRGTARGPISKKLLLAFDRLANHEGDIIDLALDAHLLFTLEAPDESKARRAGGGRSQRRERDGAGRDFDDEGTFRHHVERVAATGRTGRYAVTDAALTDLLDIVIRGTRSIAQAAERAALDELAQLQAGEDEDDVGQQASGSECESGEQGAGVDDGHAPPPPPDESNAPARRIYAVDELEHRRRHLVRAVESFEGMLAKLTANHDRISIKLCAQTVFIFHLILFGCALRHHTATGGMTRLIELTLPPGPNPDRSNCFAIRIASLLKRLWGDGAVTGLLSLLEWVDDTGEMPDDLFYLVVMSRWAAGRACLALSTSPAPLANGMRKLAVHCYRETLRFGPIDGADEHAFILNEERKLGFDQLETNAFLAEHCALLATLGPQPSAAA